MQAGFENTIANNKLCQIVNTAISDVPFYNQKYFGIEQISNQEEFKLNILRKSEIVGNEEFFLSKRYNPKFLLMKSTGGTTGAPLKLYTTFKSVIQETAFIDSIFAQIEASEKLKIAVLRGNKPSKGIYEYTNGCLILSSYDLNLVNVRLYIKLIKKYKINCLHVYPSSIQILIKLMKELGNTIEFPFINGIVSSSEILSLEDKKSILRAFPKSKLIDIYGQNEHIALGYSINLGYYNFIQNYSLVEFIETGKTNVNNKIYEIVGTNYSNSAMPLIRYGIEDYVEIDASGNIIAIIGRTQDFLINNAKETVPCIVIQRSCSKANIINFQYFQDREGEMEYRVVVNDKFGIKDENAILLDMNKTFNGKMRVNVVRVSNIEKTTSGKQKRLVQLLDISKY